MAVPEDRRVIFKTYVVPKKEYSVTSTLKTREEGSTVGRAPADKYRLNTTVGKVFGGSGIRTISAEQHMDGWTSFLSPIDNQWQAVDNVWNLDETVWDGELAVTSSRVLRSGSSGIKFLYVKNTGLTNDVELTLNDSNYHLVIPPGGSVSLRLKESQVLANEIKVRSTGSTVEYIIAK